MFWHQWSGLVVRWTEKSEPEPGRPEDLDLTLDADGEPLYAFVQRNSVT